MFKFNLEEVKEIGTVEQNSLVNANCLEAMKFIPDESVDMILCDLPYEKTHNDWDCIIPLLPLWNQYKRIIKEKGAMIFTGQGLFTVNLILSCKELYRYSLIWEKTKAGGFLNAKKMPLQAHEDIIIFYKQLPTYNPIMEYGKPYIKKAITNGDGKNYGKFERQGVTKVNNGERFPRSVVKISNDNHKSLHPTQKPVKLFEYLIKTYTDEGDLVLDNAAGSGTTAVAAINTKRNFILIEKEEKYCDIIEKRIKEINEI